MYGPVRTVVWEGRRRETPPYPDCRAIAAGDSIIQEVDGRLALSGLARPFLEARIVGRLELETSGIVPRLGG